MNRKILSAFIDFLSGVAIGLLLIQSYTWMNEEVYILEGISLPLLSLILPIATCLTFVYLLETDLRFFAKFGRSIIGITWSIGIGTISLAVFAILICNTIQMFEYNVFYWVLLLTGLLLCSYSVQSKLYEMFIQKAHLKRLPHYKYQVVRYTAAIIIDFFVLCIIYLIVCIMIYSIDASTIFFNYNQLHIQTILGLATIGTLVNLILNPLGYNLLKLKRKLNS